MSKLKKRKIPCDCVCSGPFCNTLVHCKNTRLHIDTVKTQILKDFVKYLKETYEIWDDLPMSEINGCIEDFLAVY